MEGSRYRLNTALTSSIASCDRLVSNASTFCLSCSRLVAPMMVDVTNHLWREVGFRVWCVVWFSLGLWDTHNWVVRHTSDIPHLLSNWMCMCAPCVHHLSQAHWQTRWLFWVNHIDSCTVTALLTRRGIELLNLKALILVLYSRNKRCLNPAQCVNRSCVKAKHVSFVGKPSSKGTRTLGLADMHIRSTLNPSCPLLHPLQTDTTRIKRLCVAWIWPDFMQAARVRS